MKVYHFLNKKYGIESLQNQRIKVSVLDDLNDPFELLSNDFSDNKMRPIFNQLKTRLSDRIVMVCFSHSWKNPLLWSLYSDRHKGIALEFDVNEEEIIQVSYQKNRIKIPSDIKNQDLIDGLELKMISTKYVDWKFEDESRLFLDKSDLVKENGYYFYNFNNDFFPTSIIAGPLCKIEEKEIIDVLPMNKKIKFIRSRLAFRSFSVVKNKRYHTIELKKNV